MLKNTSDIKNMLRQLLIIIDNTDIDKQDLIKDIQYATNRLQHIVIVESALDVNKI